MGLFQQRPEEPTEWAGLPGEPWQPGSPSEQLPPPVTPVDPFGADGESISISVALPTGDEADAP